MANVCSVMYLVVFLVSISLNLLLTFSVRSVPGVSALPPSSAPSAAPSASAAASVVIVYTDRPANEQPDAYNLRTLASVLGSVEAAKESLVHTYRSAASGFSARLTPDQVAAISKQPGVVNVAQSVTNQLHLEGGGGVSTLY